MKNRILAVLIVAVMVLTLAVPTTISAGAEVNLDDSQPCDCGDCAECEFVCKCNNCDSCGFRGGRYGLGRVHGGARPTIHDALAILRFIVGLPSGLDGCDDARIAANITHPSPEPQDPVLADALQILRKLVGLLNRIDVPNLDSVQVEPRQISLKQGESTTVRARYRGEVTFASLNPNVATVDENGEITAVSNGGSTHILVLEDEIVQTIHKVNVQASTTSLFVANAPEFMTVGEMLQLDVILEPRDSVERVEIEIDNTEIAFIGWDGVLRASAKGEFTFTVTSGNISRSYTVTVEQPAINLSSLNIVVGSDDRSLSVDGTVRAVEWSSTNTRVATVGQDGSVTARRTGYTCVIAKIGGAEFYVDVWVITPLEQRISDLQNKYPEGYFWNRYTASADFPHVSETPCNHRTDNPRMCIGQCAGFAHLISNEVFGSSAGRSTVTDIDSVRQGDYVRYSNRPGHNHSVFVIRVMREGEIIGYNRWTQEHIRAESLLWLVTHCNWWSDCGILWYHTYVPHTRIETFNPRESYSRV
jgi:hypothetical protein